MKFVLFGTKRVQSLLSLSKASYILCPNGSHLQPGFLDLAGGNHPEGGCWLLTIDLYLRNLILSENKHI